MHVLVALRDFVNYKVKSHKPSTAPFPWHEDYDGNDQGGVHIDLFDAHAAKSQPSALTYKTAASVLAAAAEGYVDLDLNAPQKFQVTAAGDLVALGNILKQGMEVAPPNFNAPINQTLSAEADAQTGSSVNTVDLDGPVSTLNGPGPATW